MTSLPSPDSRKEWREKNGRRRWKEKMTLHVTHEEDRERREREEEVKMNEPNPRRITRQMMEGDKK